MAPEQTAGGPLTPAADQYAFCSSLREGVATHSEVPRWLDAIIRRGTATAPAQRYPSMDALLAALANDPASRWRRRTIALGIVVLAAGTFVIGRADRDDGPSCDPSRALDSAWDAAAVRSHVEGLHTAYAPEAAAQLVTMLDDYAARWRTGHRDACVAHRDGAQSATLFDRRIACLTTARSALARASEIARSTPANKLASMVVAVRALPDLGRCGDPNALVAQSSPPAAIAAQVAALDDELAALEVEVRAARPDARTRVQVLVERARALGHTPLVARAQRLAGKAAVEIGRLDEAIQPLTEAMHLALQIDDRALAVESFALRMWDIAMGDPTAARAGLDLVEAIASGLSDHDRAIRAELANAIGGTALAAGDRVHAREAFRRALELSRGVSGPKAFELAGVLSNLAIVTDDPARALAYARDRIAIVEHGLGATHPLTLAARISAAYHETHRDRAREALAAPCDRLAETQPDHDFEILDCEVEVGWLAFERGNEADMRRAFGRAAATAAGGTGTRLELARAHLARLAGNATEATHIVDAALATLGPLDAAAWWTLSDAADLEIARGRLETARALLERVIATNPTVLVARRLAFVSARTGAVDAAVAWYRAAGGYDAELAALTAK